MGWFRTSALLAASLALAGSSLAQQLPDAPPLPVWGPNGSVRALARAGQALVVGGQFDYVGPATGGFVTADANGDGAVSAGAFVLGPVRALASDGAGGWFVSASTQRGSGSQRDVLHILADGSRDVAWMTPVLASGAAVGYVSSVAVDGDRVFVAGQFDTVNGVARDGLAAFDRTTGAVLPWAVDFTEPAGIGNGKQIGAQSAGRLYVAGNFSAANGQPRAGVAAVDTTTGAVLPFSVGGTGTVEVAAATAAAVYARCGSALCAFDLTGAPLAGWAPPALDNAAFVEATASAVYTSMAEPGHWRVIALHPATGARLPWNGPVVDVGPVDIEAAGGRLYLGGGFATVNGAPRTRLAAIDASSGALLSWAPSVGAVVRRLAVEGARVAIAGDFNTAGGVTRRNVAAIDLATGLARPSPALDFEVWALHTIGDIVVAAGGSNGGQGRVEAFSASTGARLPWGLDTDGVVYAVASTNRYLFIAGQFHTIGGQPRNGIAAVDLATAALAPLDQGAVWSVLSMAVANDVVYASGFVPVPGNTQPITVALDAATLSRLPFTPTPAPNTTVGGFAFAPGRVLLVGVMSQGPPQAGWFDAASGQAIPRTSPMTFAGGRAAQHGSTVIVSGTLHPGLQIAIESIDTASGNSRPWDPELVDGMFPFVNAVHAADDFVVLGGIFDMAAGIPVANLAVFRAPSAAAPQQVTSRVSGHTVTLGWKPGSTPAATSFVVEAGTISAASDIGRFNVGAATSVSGNLPAGRYFIRVRGVSGAGEGHASSEVIADVPAASTSPSTPGTLTASVAGGVVSLAWGAATGNPTSYVVEAGSAPGLADIVVFSTGHLDTQLAAPAPPGRYFIRVRGANESGAGAATNDVAIVVP